MSLSRKNSRNIQVDGKSYCWMFFENSGWNDLTVQSASGGGRKLSVQIPWENDGSANMPYKSVTPSMVSRAIRFALESGWNPVENGSPVVCRFHNGVLDLLKM